MAEQQCPTCHEQGMEEGVSDLLITYQTATPNSYRLIKRPITKSCMRSVLEKQIVRRTNRLIRVRKFMGSVAKLLFREFGSL
jgi:hypothetical protein